MINNKNSKVERKIIDDHINIQGTEISIKLHVNNWGEAFDPRLLKKRIEQSIQESGVEVQDIKNIEATTWLIKYTDKNPVFSLYNMEDTELIVYLNNGERIQLNIEQQIKIL
ncbi:hypothetical protein KA001_03020 [Patescibacteria group bacterium]|jgi:adenine-specific DNA methylase|nr:hypothetical protein [Patescibacteria group bacterium]